LITAPEILHAPTLALPAKQTITDSGSHTHAGSARGRAPASISDVVRTSQWIVASQDRANCVGAVQESGRGYQFHDQVRRFEIDLIRRALDQTGGINPGRRACSNDMPPRLNPKSRLQRSCRP